MILGLPWKLRFFEKPVHEPRQHGKLAIILQKTRKTGRFLINKTGDGRWNQWCGASALGTSKTSSALNNSTPGFALFIPFPVRNPFAFLRPNVYVRDRVSEEFLGRIRGLVDRVATEPLSVVLEVGSMAAEGLPLSAEEAQVAPGMASRGAAPSAYDINPDFTFESFVVGRSNEMAKAAAQRVAENAGQSYNPLLLYGGGSGENPSSCRP